MPAPMPTRPPSTSKTAQRLRNRCSPKVKSIIARTLRDTPPSVLNTDHVINEVDSEDSESVSTPAIIIAARKGAAGLQEMHNVLDAVTEKADLLTTDRDNRENTALHIAVQAGCVQCVKYLCEAGAPLAAVNEQGRHPLDIAVAENDFDIARMLLRYGADPTLKNAISGDTVLHVARKPDMIDILMNDGAGALTPDVHERNKCENTAWDGAHARLLMNGGQRDGVLIASDPDHLPTLIALEKLEK